MIPCENLPGPYWLKPFRKQAVFQNTPQNVTDLHDFVALLEERDELRRRLATAIESLPPIQREVLVLREFEGLRYREIADLLEIPEGTVMSRLYAARNGLAVALGDDL